ncbi:MULTISPECIES: hypothetical protein [unclassified Streptomyces]|uniref:hypothetical protein n=1 Tax=unclassified Streptomyces TaxID=2593676 RepID=UPI0034507E7A
MTSPSPRDGGRTGLDGGEQMADFLADLPVYAAFAVIWGSAFTVLMAGSLLRLGYTLKRDRWAMRRFFEAGASAPVLAAYHLGGEREAARTGVLVLARRQRRSRVRRRARKEARNAVRPDPDPVLAALQTAVRDAGGADVVERVMEAPGFRTFIALLRRTARRGLPVRRVRYVPDRAAAWAAVGALVAVLAYGIGHYVRQPDPSGAWLLVVVAAHVPAGIWIGATARQGGRYAAPQWPEFDALCERLVDKERARGPRPKRAAGADARPAGTAPAERPGQARTSGWANDGGVGATSSCGGGGGCGGCGGGV